MRNNIHFVYYRILQNDAMMLSATTCAISLGNMVIVRFLPLTTDELALLVIYRFQSSINTSVGMIWLRVSIPVKYNLFRQYRYYIW